MMYNFSLIKEKFTKFLPLVLFIFSFAIYAFTAAPTIYPRDNAEFITAVYTLGIPHPPGYPLYVILGKIFTLFIPFGSVAFKVNLVSGFFGALTIVLLFLILEKLTKNIAAALIAALTLAFSQLFWFYSTIADVFTLNTFWLLLIIWLLLIWRQKVKEGKSTAKLLYLIALLFGLGLGNQQTLIFILPALIYLVFTTDKTVFQPKKLLSLFLVSLSSLVLIYSFLYFRSRANPFLDWGNPENLKNLLAVFLRQEFGGAVLSKNYVTGWSWTTITSHFKQYFSSFLNQFYLWGLLLGLGGLIHLFFKERKYFYFTISALAFLGPVMVFLLSNIPLNENVVYVIEKFYLASFVVFSFLIGFGIISILEKLTFLSKNFKFLDINKVLIALIILVLPLYSLISNWSENNKHNYFFDYDYVFNSLNSLEPNAILISPNDSVIFGIWYFQQVKNFRTDVITLHPIDSPITYQQFRQRYPKIFNQPLTKNKIFTKITFPPSVKKDAWLELLKETILKNIEARPIYFSIGDSNFYSPFLDFLIPQGLVYQLTSNYNSPVKEKLLFAKKLLWEDYQYRGQYKIEGNTPFIDKEILSRYVFANNDLGVFLFGQEDYQSALSLFRKALMISPEATITKNNLTLITRIEDILNRLKENPNDLKLNLTLIDLYRQNRQFNKAAEIMQKIITLKPTDAAVYNNYGMVLLKIGEFQEAKTNFQKAIELSPQLTAAQKNLNFVNYLLAD